MATRKKAKAKKHGPRRLSSKRRVGAMDLNPASPIVLIGSAAVGYLLGDQINGAVDHVTGTMDGKIVGGIEAGLGAGLMFLKLGKKKTMLEVIPGGILAGAGAKRLLREFGVINGFQSVPVLGKRMVNGYRSVPVLGAYTTAREALNGTAAGGYTTERVPMHSQVMGNAGGNGSGSGLTVSNGSDLMG